MLKEQERKLLVEDTDDYLLSLVQDSTGRKNSKFEQSMLRAKEELAKAEEEETKAKEMLGKAKEQVLILVVCVWVCHFSTAGLTVAEQNRPQHDRSN